MLNKTSIGLIGVLRQQSRSAKLLRSVQIHRTRTHGLVHIELFSSSRQLGKKKRNAHQAVVEGDDLSSTAKAVDGAPIKAGAQDEAFDFSTMERKILKIIEHMTHLLADVKTMSQLSPAVFEHLQVQPDKKSSDLVKLSDLAQVVKRGRQIHIILNDETHIKPVKSAVLGSDLSLNPQGPTEDAPTTLVVNTPPPTGESRQAALDSITRIYNSALDQVREARQAKHKKLRAMQIAKTVNPDDLQKAHKEMEKIVKKFSDEIKSLTDIHRGMIAR